MMLVHKLDFLVFYTVHKTADVTVTGFQCKLDDLVFLIHPFKNTSVLYKGVIPTIAVFIFRGLFIIILLLLGLGSKKLCIIKIFKKDLFYLNR